MSRWAGRSRRAGAYAAPLRADPRRSRRRRPRCSHRARRPVPRGRATRRCPPARGTCARCTAASFVSAGCMSTVDDHSNLSGESTSKSKYSMRELARSLTAILPFRGSNVQPWFVENLPCWSRPPLPPIRAIGEAAVGAVEDVHVVRAVAVAQVHEATGGWDREPRRPIQELRVLPKVAVALPDDGAIEMRLRELLVDCLRGTGTAAGPQNRSPLSRS